LGVVSLVGSLAVQFATASIPPVWCTRPSADGVTGVGW